MTRTTTDVLHVEDDEAFSKVVRTYIQRHHDDISVYTVHDAADALAYLEATNDIDCVVSDYEMPRKTGLELLAVVRDRWPDLPFILFTGNGCEMIDKSASAAGVTNYVQKGSGPAQFAVLVNRIRDVVAH